MKRLRSLADIDLFSNQFYSLSTEIPENISISVELTKEEADKLFSSMYPFSRNHQTHRFSDCIIQPPIGLKFKITIKEE